MNAVSFLHQTVKRRRVAATLSSGAPKRRPPHAGLLLLIAAFWLASIAPAFAQPTAPAPPMTVRVASFNIQFLGHFKDRDDAALADLMVPFDLIFVQELVAPPYAGLFPDGTPFQPDPDAARFFDAMAARGYQWVLSEEDTGTSDRQHDNGPATEWYVAFYRPQRVSPDPALATGFLAEDHYNHPDYERVPYAFGFRAGSEDLVFISVHLKPDADSASRKRRAQELNAIEAWIAAQRASSAERDYVILGDMKLEDCTEMSKVLPVGYASLNITCRATNTNPNSPKPYDHVMIDVAQTQAEVPFRFDVINLVASMRSRWDPSRGPYPGDPYVRDDFRTVYSDHNPVGFEIIVDGLDDDGTP